MGWLRHRARSWKSLRTFAEGIQDAFKSKATRSIRHHLGGDFGCCPAEGTRCVARSIVAACKDSACPTKLSGHTALISRAVEEPMAPAKEAFAAHTRHCWTCIGPC